MSTPYNPTGQVVPTDEYVLPQDVVDLVVSESVNNPFIVGADNIAWILLILSCSVNVKNFGAVGDGSTDDTAAIQAAINYACLNGGWVFFPPGFYRVTGTLSNTKSCTLFGVPDLTRIALDDAADHFFLVDGSSITTRVIGIKLDGLQVNSGNVFRTLGSDNFLLIESCAINTSGFLAGRLAVGFYSVTIANEAGRLIESSYTGAAYWLSAQYLSVRGSGTFTMAPAATYPLIGNSGSSGRVNLTGARFRHFATGPGGNSFVDVTTGRTVVSGCSFDADSSGAGGATYAFNLNGGQLNNSGCAFDGDCIPYLFGLPCASGSNVQPGPGILFNAAASATIVIPDGAASARITSTVSAAPTVRLPHTLSEGQPFSVSLFNGGASTWSGEVAWKKADGTQALTEDTTAFAGLEVGQSFTMSFVVVEIASNLYWQQVGKVAVLT